MNRQAAAGRHSGSMGATRRREVTGQDLVTVIVPAFNAARTIDETLRSVRGQTHGTLEILVIDDGSIDETPWIVSQHVLQDPRVRLIRQPNSGVAAARNRGIAEALADVVAPVDADDLWHPDKIRRHLEVMRAGGPEVGLVYDWYAAIDASGGIIAASRRPRAQGRILREMCRGNLPGNGSSVTMRKAVVLEAGGYDVSLRAQGAQGCEDWELYLRIAARSEVRLVPAFLTGYRIRRGSMSRNVRQMRRSGALVIERARRAHPEYAAELQDGWRQQLHWLAARALEGGRPGVAARLLIELALEGKGGLVLLSALPLRLLGKSLRGLVRQARPRFPIGNPPCSGCGDGLVAGVGGIQHAAEPAMLQRQQA